jgi:hypothetical protein
MLMQLIVLIIFSLLFLYSSGIGGCAGPGFPLLEVTTGGLDALNEGVVTGAVKLPPNPELSGGGANDDATGAGVGFTAAPAIFSCVRPKAAIPSTAPMAKWNKPAPCSVSGCHCVIG